MVLDGAYGKGSRSARRHKGFNRLPLTSKPAVRADGDWYPPSGIPAPTLVNLRGNRRPEIVAPIPDGRIYAISPKGKRLWRYDYAHGRAKTFASEVVAADLDRDGRSELVFGTYGLALNSGRLVVLPAKGKKLYDLRLRHQGTNGNGIGIGATERQRRGWVGKGSTELRHVRRALGGRHRRSSAQSQPSSHDALRPGPESTKLGRILS